MENTGKGMEDKEERRRELQQLKDSSLKLNEGKEDKYGIVKLGYEDYTAWVDLKTREGVDQKKIEELEDGCFTTLGAVKEVSVGKVKEVNKIVAVRTENAKIELTQISSQIWSFEAQSTTVQNSHNPDFYTATPQIPYNLEQQVSIQNDSGPQITIQNENRTSPSSTSDQEQVSVHLNNCKQNTTLSFHLQSSSTPINTLSHLSWDSENNIKLTLQTHSSTTALFYCLGSRSHFRKIFNRNYKMWNTDSWNYKLETDPLYQSHPMIYIYNPQHSVFQIFFFENFSYQNWVILPEENSISIRSQASLQKHIKFYLLTFSSPIQLSRSWNQLTGFNTLPPLWVMYSKIFL